MKLEVQDTGGIYGNMMIGKVLEVRWQDTGHRKLEVQDTMEI